eukprot:jgi/Tetstr1/421029/TSEL_012074.t1
MTELKKVHSKVVIVGSAPRRTPPPSTPPARELSHCGPIDTEATCDTLIISTGAVAKRLDFEGSHEGEGGYWNKGMSACAVCDGAAPLFRRKPLAVVGRRRTRPWSEATLSLTKFEFIWSHVPVGASGNEKGLLSSLKLKSTKTGEIQEIECNGLFFAIGHKPATDFLDGQLELDEDGYIVTVPGKTNTSVPGVFACGDVQDKLWRQAITAAGSGCMAALQAEHLLASEESFEAERQRGGGGAAGGGGQRRGGGRAVTRVGLQAVTHRRASSTSVLAVEQ